MEKPITHTLIGWRHPNSLKRECFAFTKITPTQANARNRIFRAKKLHIRWSSTP